MGPLTLLSRKKKRDKNPGGSEKAECPLGKLLIKVFLLDFSYGVLVPRMRLETQASASATIRKLSVQTMHRSEYPVRF